MGSSNSGLVSTGAISYFQLYFTVPTVETLTLGLSNESGSTEVYFNSPIAGNECAQYSLMPHVQYGLKAYSEATGGYPINILGS